MEDREEILRSLMDTVGEEGCGISCEEAEVFEDEEGWKMFMGCFMEPWFLGKTAEEAKARIKEYASMGFGLS